MAHFGPLHLRPSVLSWIYCCVHLGQLKMWRCQRREMSHLPQVCVCALHLLDQILSMKARFFHICSSAFRAKLLFNTVFVSLLGCEVRRALGEKKKHLSSFFLSGVVGTSISKNLLCQSSKFWSNRVGFHSPVHLKV